MNNPTGSNGTLVVAEDTARVLTTADFGYSDLDGDPLEAVSITALPETGQLTLNGAPVPLGWFVTATEINAGKLVFTPAANASGTGYASFSFKVSDATSVSVLAYVLTIDVTPVNDLPTAQDSTVSVDEDTARALGTADFGFADADPSDSLQGVVLTSLPTAGTLKLFGNSVMVGQVISLSNLVNGQLLFTPAANASGTGYASFGFRVSDGTAYSTAAYTLTIDVTPVRDDLVLTGTSGNDTLRGDALDPGSNDTLNGLAGDDLLEGLDGADRLDGGDGGDMLDGGDGNDELLGSAGNDEIEGGKGNDTLDGGSGSDTLNGGDGDDYYLVRDAGDVVMEASSAGGTDTLGSFISTFTLAAFIENGRILSAGAANLTGNSLKNTLYAGPGDNIIDGGTGSDTVSYENALAGVAGVTVRLSTIKAQATGGSGSDTLLRIENLIGSRYNDKLSGNAGSNRLTGGSGNDTLDGAAGNDTMTGGTGHDTYYVRDAGDKVVESYITAGIDSVLSYLSTYTLGNFIDNGRIMLAGSASMNGNALNNELSAGKGDNTLDGAAGSDTVSYLYGVSGTTGVTVSLAISAAQSTGGSGTDTLKSIENLTGSNNADDLEGNSTANVLNAAAGNDTLSGAGGNDTLTGGAGLDVFRFDSALDAGTNIDRVSDFNPADDSIELENGIFSALPSGDLAEGALRAGAGFTQAADADDRVIYDSATGALYYDADGVGGAAALQFATLPAGLTLTSADFMVA